VRRVAPHAGAWIETYSYSGLSGSTLSPLTQGRGLKLDVRVAALVADNVAPHAGAWIETLYIGQDSSQACVAPHAGAWIETGACVDQDVGFGSRPSRRGVD